MENIGQ